MKRIYRYGFNVTNDYTEQVRNILNIFRIKFTEDLLLCFEITDDHPYFYDIKKQLDALNVNVMSIKLDYTKQELESAEYLDIWLKKYSGYPQPETIDVKESYLNYTYDISNFCTKCGSGLEQNDSFYVKKSFDINKTVFGGLYWVYDTFFVTRELRDIMVKENFTGIEILPVKNIKTRKPVDNIFQLKVTSLFPSDLIFEKKKTIQCRNCGRTKYLASDDSELSVSKDVLKILNQDFYLSRELHGDGLLCCHQVLISKRVYKFLMDNKIKNINAKPVKFV